MNFLEFIGRGSAFNTKEGSTAAFHKTDDGAAMMLIDCGESTFGDLLRLRLLDDVSELDVLITHTHPDHIGSLGSLIFYCFFKLAITPNLVQHDPHTMASIIQILRLNGVEDSMYNIKNFLMPYVIGSSLVTHVDEMQNQMFVLFDPVAERNIVYTGDTNDTIALKGIYSLLTKQTGKTPIVYTDCCLAEYDQNPHMSLSKLCELFPKEVRQEIFCMHLDSSDTIRAALKENFNVVHRINRVKLYKLNIEGVGEKQLDGTDAYVTVDRSDLSLKFRTYDNKMNYIGTYFEDDIAFQVLI